jgi:cation diffusion facilitator family transporter
MSGHHHTHANDGASHGAGKAVSITLAVNLCVTAAKWFAFAITRSPSLFGEAAHSTADSMNPLVLWLGHRRSSRPPHARHPLGHGREAYFWSLIAAQLMLLVGAALTAWHGVETIVTGSVPRISVLALAVMGCAAVGESYSLLVVWRHMRQERQRGSEGSSPILLALLVENGADVLGVLLAFAGYGIYSLTGNALWDAGFSLSIAAMLTCTSIFLINRSRSLLIGESGGPKVEQEIMAALMARPAFVFPGRITSVIHGPHDTEVRLELLWNETWFVSRTDASESNATIVSAVLRDGSGELDDLRAEIRRRSPQVTSVVIEVSWQP